MSYRQEKRNTSESNVPKKESDKRYCNCGLPKVSEEDDGCTIYTSNIMHLVKNIVMDGKVPLNSSNCFEFNVEFVEI